MNKTISQIEEKLKSIYQLQIIDSQIDEIKTYRGELPLEVEHLSEQVEEVNTQLEALNSKIEECEQSISDQKNIAKDAKEKLKKYNKQIDNVKNNREYNSINKEIEFEELSIELSKKKIKESEEKIEIIGVDVKTTNKELKEKKSVFKEKKKELENIISSTEKQEAKLVSKSNKISKSIDERLIKGYHKIRKASRNGLAVVKITRNSCGGCYAVIPPQRKAEVDSCKKIITCENCGRILVKDDF